ncbi:MAG: hypothetical protein IKE91_01080 [Clostridia bacterium]|nr:hypothetical protein [Clostridia bacterium]
MDVKKLEKEQSKFNTKVVKEIFEKIEKEFKSKVGPLHMAVSEDNKEFSETQEYSKLLDTISRAKKEDWIMDNNSKTTIYEGLGSIGVISNDVSDVSLYLILKALKTHNRLVLFVEDKIHEVTKKIIEIVNNVCKEEKYNTYIDYCEYKDFKELYDYADKFETFIFVNNIEKYFKFTDKVKDKNVIYSSYGTMSLYLDDKNLKDELLRMDEYVFNNNIELDLIKEVDVEEAVERINKNLDNYAAVIFTKDTKKAYYFIENVKAKQVFVNKNPYKDYLFEIDDEKLTKLKRIYI